MGFADRLTAESRTQCEIYSFFAMFSALCGGLWLFLSHITNELSMQVRYDELINSEILSCKTYARIVLSK